MGIHPHRRLGNMVLPVLLIACVAGAAWAQKPVYQCGGIYTDKPCKDGKEVDIAPTRGAHSMSGTKRMSQEAQMEEMKRGFDKAQEEGARQARQLRRCGELHREREAIDRAGQPEALKDRRFAIRQEQFQLNCRRT